MKSLRVFSLTSLSGPNKKDGNLNRRQKPLAFDPKDNLKKADFAAFPAEFKTQLNQKATKARAPEKKGSTSAAFFLFFVISPVSTP